MTNQPTTSGWQLHQQIAATARDKARQAVNDIVAVVEGRTVTRLRAAQETWPGTSPIEPEPIAALEAAKALEDAAHELIGQQIRLAREAGRTWHDIGDALDLLPRASMNKISTGEEAYDYALSYLPYIPGGGRPAYTWTCPACQHTITDRGPFLDVPDREEGHQPACPRRTAELARWQAYRSR